MATSTQENQTVQIVVYIKRNPVKTQKQFYHYWENTHAPLVAPWAQKHGIISYRQVLV
jgi:hypothetical protein